MRFENKLGLGAHLIQPIQRGPRYSLLAKKAAKNVSPEDKIFYELDTLQRLISTQLFEINSAMGSLTSQTKGYWFGKITYTLLFGEPGKIPVKPEPIPVKIEESEDGAEPYQFGEYIRSLIWAKPKANTSRSKSASSVPVEKASDEILDEFEHEEDKKSEDNDPSKDFGHQG